MSGIDGPCSEVAKDPLSFRGGCSVRSVQVTLLSRFASRNHLALVDFDTQPIAPVGDVGDVDALPPERKRIEVAPTPRETHPDRFVILAATALANVDRLLRGVFALSYPVVVAEADLGVGPSVRRGAYRPPRRAGASG